MRRADAGEQASQSVSRKPIPGSAGTPPGVQVAALTLEQLMEVVGARVRDEMQALSSTPYQPPQIQPSTPYQPPATPYQPPLTPYQPPSTKYQSLQMHDLLWVSRSPFCPVSLMTPLLNYWPIVVVVRFCYWVAPWMLAWVIRIAFTMFYSSIWIGSRDNFGKLSCLEGTFMLISGLRINNG